MKLRPVSARAIHGRQNAVDSRWVFKMRSRCAGREYDRGRHAFAYSQGPGASSRGDGLLACNTASRGVRRLRMCRHRRLTIAKLTANFAQQRQLIDRPIGPRTIPRPEDAWLKATETGIYISGAANVRCLTVASISLTGPWVPKVIVTFISSVMPVWIGHTQRQ